MAITIGTRLGSLEVTALLGKGGMGEVYRARDMKLKREVAIKILPDEFSRDSDRIGRFQREAEVLASLNHPNIATIHSLEEANGSRFLVLELVDGETLAERIQSGSLQIDEALQIAKSICEALEAAHEKGVIHRDLKPANVKITAEGKVKVLDFGLAKALESAPVSGNLSYSPTLSIAGTQAGMILGTAAYMSPEQAKGFNTDQRSDIFSFGAVLYEMLAGRQAFQGDNVSEVLASVLAREPNLELLPPRLNPKLLELLRRALEKNPKRRWHAVGDVRMELEAVLADPHGVVVDQRRETAAPKPLWKRAIPVLLTLVLTAAGATAVTEYFRPAPVLNVTRFPVILADGQQFSGTSRTSVAISPDGTQIVYVANNRLYLRPMSESQTRPIPGGESANVVNPVFSPDGKSVLFWSASDRALKKLAVTGGAAVTICPAETPYGVSWGEDGILFGQASKGIMRVSAAGGTPDLLVNLKGGEVAYGPQMLPGGQSVLFTLGTGGGGDTWDHAQIVVQSLKTGERKMLIPGGSDARYVSTGHIVYAFGGTLFAVPFDARRLEVTPGPVPVIEGVRRAYATGAAHYSFSNTGSLIYIPGPASATAAQRALGMIDRKGSTELLKLPPGPYLYPRLSPDGKRIAVTTENGKEANISVYELSGATLMQRLTVGGANRHPLWSTDGERVAFQSDREGDFGIWWQRADGSGTAERLTKADQGVLHIPDSWSPDGKLLSFTAVKGNEASVWILSLPDKKPVLFADTPSSFVSFSAFSPDGHWLAYQATEMGSTLFNIWVRPFPATGSSGYQVSKDGGVHPIWSRGGSEIVYYDRTLGIVAVSVKAQSGLSFGNPTALARYPVRDVRLPRDYDLERDGSRFIALVSGDAQSQSGTVVAPQIEVVLNWFEDLKQRMSAK